ncbi:MAG: porin family protein [Bauldia sp.]|nr:porin family protein [Bauldia sp.]
MQKKLVIGLAVATALTSAPAAFAQDWNGFYIGVNTGVGLLTATGPNGNMDGDIGQEGGNVTTTGWGAVGGIGAGVNMVLGAAFLGVEADINWTNLHAEYDLAANNIAYIDNYLFKADWNWYSTARVRMGVTVDRGLFFVTGGAAFVNVDYAGCYYDDCTPADQDYRWSGMQVGLVVGAGGELALSDHASLKLEYLHIGLPSTDPVMSVYNTQYDLPGQAIFTSSANILRVGLNWNH